MKITPKKLNSFLLFKLPSAYFTGVRTKHLDAERCIVSVKHRWINQNPFKSLFWAVQGMAAELTTGALIINKIEASGKNIAMLLVKNDASYSKKATGRITFECSEGLLVDEVINKAIQTELGEQITLNVVGKNSNNIEVSRFTFTWSVKVRA
ncbi:DUF4442 domain-containing protein [Xanthomarina sp. GH4-25]|uniref:DUF4442 domain-containing protein n=1 Tax=Xanthomarina sp. GH4-25 TaxID=3349335 RepID=UPI000D6773A6|nr:thioesterase [Flavobacteriaceae bacterium LYZ1037]